MSTPPWHGILWHLLGLFALLFGITWTVVAERQFRFWLYADHYVDAELEVTRFYPRSRDSDAPCRIEGVIHPGGEQIVTSDRDIAINVHNGPDDRWGHHPAPEEIEGKRLPILYWPHSATEERWWHPPNICSRGYIARTGAVARDVLIALFFLIAGSAAFRRGARILKASAPPEPPQAQQRTQSP